LEIIVAEGHRLPSRGAALVYFEDSGCRVLPRPPKAYEGPKPEDRQEHNKHQAAAFAEDSPIVAQGRFLILWGIDIIYWRVRHLRWGLTEPIREFSHVPPLFLASTSSNLYRIDYF
jgi:hypothetical protein